MLSTQVAWPDFGTRSPEYGYRETNQIYIATLFGFIFWTVSFLVLDTSHSITARVETHHRQPGLLAHLLLLLDIHSVS